MNTNWWFILAIVLLEIVIVIRLDQIISLLKTRRVVADSLYLVINIDHIQIKLNMAQLTLPIGATVVATIKGSGKDAGGNVVDAPVNAASLSADTAGLVQIDAVPGSTVDFKLTSLADGAPTLIANAKNSLGADLAAATVQIQTGAGVAVPVVADTLSIAFGDITLP